MELLFRVSGKHERFGLRKPFTLELNRVTNVEDEEGAYLKLVGSPMDREKDAIFMEVPRDIFESVEVGNLLRFAVSVNKEVEVV